MHIDSLHIQLKMFSYGHFLWIIWVKLLKNVYHWLNYHIKENVQWGWYFTETLLWCMQVLLKEGSTVIIFHWVIWLKLLKIVFHWPKHSEEMPTGLIFYMSILMGSVQVQLIKQYSATVIFELFELNYSKCITFSQIYWY